MHMHRQKTTQNPDDSRDHVLVSLTFLTHSVLFFLSFPVSLAYCFSLYITFQPLLNSIRPQPVSLSLLPKHNTSQKSSLSLLRQMSRWREATQTRLIVLKAGGASESPAGMAEVSVH